MQRKQKTSLNSEQQKGPERIVEDEESKFTVFGYSLWICFRFAVNCNTPFSFSCFRHRDNTDTELLQR